MKVAIFQFSLFGINTYVVYDPATKECAVIDPGMSAPEEREALRGFIDRNGLKVTHLINTHLHVDHVAGNSFVSATYGVEPEAHAGDEPLGRQIGQQACMFGLRDEVADVALGHRLQEGDTIRVGDGELKVIHVPGHSPGGLALYDKADGFVIAGDSLFYRSIGRTDLAGGNHQQLITALKEKLLTLPDDTVVYPGHGEPTTIGEEKRGNMFLR